MIHRLFTAGIALLFSLGSPSSYAASPRLDYTLVASYPHIDSVFTQGLELFQGRLYESSGLYGRSRVLSSPFPPDTTAPKDLRGVALPDWFFAEGLTFYRGRLYLLSWREGMLFVLDPHSFTLLEKHRYAGHGWGLCAQKDRLVMSDGSATLQWRDARTFAPLGSLKVHDQNGPVDKLNELECHGPYILANRWKSTEVFIISAHSGMVIARLDLSALVPPGLHEEAVLNGIAYDANDGSWLVTGKLWPNIHRIRFTLPKLAPVEAPLEQH